MKCGDCKDFIKIGDETFCKPLKDKYGYEPVNANQSPSPNCHLDQDEQLPDIKIKRPFWYNDKPTEKQIKAIMNMNKALGGESTIIPKTKGECSGLIGKLKNTIIKNVMISGSIKANHGIFCPCADCERDDSQDDVLDMEDNS